MTVNVANIDKMIKAISIEANPIHMSDYVDRNTDCGTTACLAGWANILALDGKGKGADYEFRDSTKAAKWMGLPYSQARKLFFNYSADELPEEERKTATLELLTKLKTDPDTTWANVLDEDTFRPSEYEEYEDDDDDDCDDDCCSG